MIHINDLRKSYGQQLLFDGISFSLSAGERVGLVGRNGHGKTTLFRMILGEEQPDSGEIRIPRHYRIGHLSQRLRFTESTVLGEACLYLPKTEDSSDETYKAERILMGLGFSSEEFNISPFSLSGGYQVRLNLAKLLASKPNLLLLDEPTNYLDILSIRWLTRFLQTWKEELILITHDRNFMDRVTTHTLGIHRSRVRKIAGSTQKLYDQILMEEEVHEKTRVRDEKKRKDTERFINRFRAQATRARAVQSRVKALGKKELLEKITTTKNLAFSFTAAPFHGKRLLEAQNLSFSFDPAAPPLIDNFSLSVAKGDRIAVVGQNGRGKSTLLNLLAGELPPVKGSVAGNRNLKLAYFGQTNIDRLDPEKTVEEEILDALPGHSRNTARNICGAMMFEDDKALKKIQVLSGGERSRVLIGKLLVSPANLLLLDEPSNHLDMESTDSLLEAIEAFDGAVVIVTHSEMLLQALASRLVVFDAGAVRIYEGTYDDFLSQVGWQSEGDPEEANGSPGEGAERNRSKKDMRRERAALITSRTKALESLQSRMSELEKTIITLEKDIAAANGALVEAASQGDGPLIQKLSKSVHDARGRADTLYDELAELTAEHDKRARAFAEQLNALNTKG
jgi:ATP-binding cassette subfamily F protein 3